MSDIINGLPNICGDEDKIIRKKTSHKKSFYSSVSNINFSNVRASFGIALHMHQPTILAWPHDLWKSPMISNLQYMMENQHIGDNHNAPVFMQCYKRMSWIVRDLVNQGKNPRVMLDYSGNLLWGLRQMENGSAIEELKNIACNPAYYKNVEWLGTMWSHAVASSTPVPDLKLHMLAWRKHFGEIFGHEALERVKGFSPPEMHMPIHPDVCYEYIKALKECGYEWLMVQEHTVENLDGSGLRRPHFPHRLVAKNSLGETQEIIALIKTQGSDTKLVAQMQPYYHAKGLNKEDYAGKNIPPFICQIGDGENGGVMMNEFPPMYHNATNEMGSGTEGVVAMNGSEYLEFVMAQGIKLDDLIPIQPISQKKEFGIR